MTRTAPDCSELTTKQAIVFIALTTGLWFACQRLAVVSVGAAIALSLP